jgi:hypothetical protein
VITSGCFRSRAVVRFYNKRGTAEQWIKEGKQAVKITRLSCHRFRSNQVRLALSLLAYNLGNLWRRLGLPRGIENWSLTSLQQRLVKTGGRLVKHARYYWLLFGGRTSEPAAVRGDAGPDRAVADTDGIDRWWSGWQRNHTQRVGVRKRCRKSGRQNGSISAVLVRIGYRFCALQMQIFSRCQRTAGWVYDRCRS